MSKSYKYLHYDVFTDHLFGGNQLAVFLDGRGLSGETSTVKGVDGKDVILRKTLQLTYSVNGDEAYPGEDAIREGEGRIGRNPKAWVMR